MLCFSFVFSFAVHVLDTKPLVLFCKYRSRDTSCLSSVCLKKTYWSCIVRFGLICSEHCKMYFFYSAVTVMQIQRQIHYNEWILLMKSTTYWEIPVSFSGLLFLLHFVFLTTYGCLQCYKLYICFIILSS